MSKYIEKLNPLLKDYYSILSDDFPEFLLEYIDTPRMQKQDRISCSCGTYYFKMYNIDLWYSSLQHSIAVALVIWHFTHDKKQTLSGLFHDISTPAFKHCIDFMNNDINYVYDFPYEDNISFVNNSFEDSNCEKDDDNYYCSKDGINLQLNRNGVIRVSDNEFVCEINENNESFCKVKS